MKKIYNSLKLCFFFLLLMHGYTHAQVTFNYTGTAVTWTVPPDVVSVQVDMVGANGGQNSTGMAAVPIAISPTGVGYAVDSAGHGARVQATLAVTCGQVLTIYVGGAGPNGTSGTPTAGGYNGGGGADFAPATVTTPFVAGGGGGGASDVRIGLGALADRVLVAGGGAGAGSNVFVFTWTGTPGTFNYDKGGDGGGTIAEDGTDNLVLGGPAAGIGGSTSGGIGGIGFPWPSGGTGVLGVGGDAGVTTGGGGGGGGYYGGGGACWAGGGGGSSYSDPVIASGVTHTRGYNASGDGYIVINPIVTTAGTIVGSTNACLGGIGTYTNPTGTPGGTWTSSNTAIGSIDPVTGVASYLAVGTFDIIYTVTTVCGTYSTTLSPITVNSAPAAITGGRFEICEHDADTLFDATPGGTWTSVSTSVVTIDPATGVITGSSAGNSIISYYTGVGCPALVILTVDPLPSAISGPSVICAGATITMNDPYPGGTWSSNYAPAGSIDISGNFTAVGGSGAYGLSTQILYTLATGCYVSHYVSIDIPGSVITGPVQTCLGNNILLTDSVSGGTWSSSVTGVATIGSTGLVISVGMGVTTISYTTNGCLPVSMNVTVNPLPAPITGSTAICPGYITTLTDASPGGSWLSSDSRVSVSPTGDVTSAFAGIPPVTIYYTLPTTCFTTITVNVTNSPSLIAGPDSLCQGLTGTMSATPPAGSTTGIWSSTSLAIAPIDTATGTITALAAGTVTVSYTLSSGCYSQKSFVVERPALDAVTVAAFPPGAVCSGDPVTLIATSINGGPAPLFSWKKFSTTIPGATSNVFVDTPTHGDVINVFMTPDNGTCVQYSLVADSFFMNVYPDTMQPLVMINTPGPLGISMLGQTVAFFSNVTWGGTGAKYQWYVNNHASPGATNSSFSLTIYAPDTVYCSVTGNAPCPAGVVVPGVSNSIVIGDVLGVKPLGTSGDNISIVPNPSNGSFVLSGTLANVTVDEVTYDISNMIGQVIYTGAARPNNGKLNEAIKLANAADGNYLLKVNTGTGVQSFHIVVAK